MKSGRRKLSILRKKLSEFKLDAFIITHLPNVRYLTGFSGSSGLCVVTRKNAYFVTDFRYRGQAMIEVKNFKRIIAFRKPITDVMFEAGILNGIKKVGFEANHISYSFLKKLKKKFKGIKFIPVDDLIERISSVKFEDEIENIVSAIKISEKVYSEVLNFIKPGVSEIDIAAEITYLHRKYGAEKDAFDVIVASGWRSALPHGVASEKKLKKGEPVVIDFGCFYKGYCSDITRTIFIGKRIPSELKKIYQIVLDAQLKAIDAIRSGITADEIDSIARSYINEKGYGKYFGHSLGHGIGVEVHTLPRVSPGSKDVLESGNIITIEPGIYLPGLGGVRIEDDVLVLNSSFEVLTSLPKNLTFV